MYSLACVCVWGGPVAKVPPSLSCGALLRCHAFRSPAPRLVLCEWLAPGLSGDLAHVEGAARRWGLPPDFMEVGKEREAGSAAASLGKIEGLKAGRSLLAKGGEVAGLNY
jgi:hypothetical protein